jgi:putative ABC transport system ATP-binding protein
MSFLEMRRVSKVYGQEANPVKALSDVNLSVDEGALVAVMGPSGSGKSTLLTIAGSLEEPSSGDVVVGGAALSRMSRNDKARLRRRVVGYVFQDFNLLPGLTAAENVSLPLELDGLSARKAHSVGMAALDELGLGDRSGHFPDQLSGGERQRVAIARQWWATAACCWRTNQSSDRQKANLYGPISAPPAISPNVSLTGSVFCGRWAPKKGGRGDKSN